MRGDARNHHYLPQAYLKGFTKGGGKKSRLYVLDKLKRRQFETRPRNVGAKRDFNRVHVDGLDPNAVETGLSPFENDVARVITRIDKNQALPTGEDFAVIMHFVALLGVRNPKIRQTFQGFQTDTLKHLGKMMVSSPEIWEQQIENVREEGYTGPELSYEEMRRFVEEDRYDIKYPTGYHLTLELASIEKVLPFLYGRKWILLIAKSHAGDFVCSDRPVAIMPTNRQFAGGPIGFGLTGTDVTIPLSRRLALSGKFESESFVLPVDSPLVAAVNVHTIYYGERFCRLPHFLAH